MNIQITGHNLDITDNIRKHVINKLERSTKATDKITNINVILSAQKLTHNAEVTVQLSGKSIFVESESQDLYTAIDLLMDKLDRQLTKYKEKKSNYDHARINDHLDQS